MDEISIAVAQGFHVAGLSLASLVIALRLWSYAPQVDAETFNRLRFRSRLFSVPFFTAFAWLSLVIYGVA